MLTIIGLLDVHMALMQTWAWVSMLNDRIPEQGLEQALDTTFSGEYPCEKCKAIAEIKIQESNQQSNSPIAPPSESHSAPKLVAVVSSRETTPLPLPFCLRIPFEAIHVRALEDLARSVPSPPPQLV